MVPRRFLGLIAAGLVSFLTTGGLAYAVHVTTTGKCIPVYSSETGWRWCDPHTCSADCVLELIYGFGTGGIATSHKCPCR
jgi:hypothetical protein